MPVPKANDSNMMPAKIQTTRLVSPSALALLIPFICLVVLVGRPVVRYFNWKTVKVLRWRW